MTATSGACLVGKGRAERPAVAEAEAELECVSVGAASAEAGLAERAGGTRLFDCGQ